MKHKTMVSFLLCAGLIRSISCAVASREGMQQRAEFYHSPYSYVTFSVSIALELIVLFEGS